MIIQCDQCSARFRLADDKVTESGVKIRCRHCQHIFLVRREPGVQAPNQDAVLLETPTGRTTASPEPPPAPEAPPLSPGVPFEPAPPASPAPVTEPVEGELTTREAARPVPPVPPVPDNEMVLSSKEEPSEEEPTSGEAEPTPPSPAPPAVTAEEAGEDIPERFTFELPAPGAPSPEPPPREESVAGILEVAKTQSSPPASRRQGPSAIAVIGMLLGCLLLLLAGGGVALYLIEGPDALEKIGLGSVVRLLETEPAVPERIMLKNLDGAYVTNGEAGELFVIRGEAVNSFRTPRTAIQVRGLIYNAAGTVILQKGSFCGTLLSPEQLATLPLARIEETLNNRPGVTSATSSVPAGNSVPFIIVFAGLPKDAADFGVEVAGSQATGH